jgi:hypothetical protein
MQQFRSPISFDGASLRKLSMAFVICCFMQLSGILQAQQDTTNYRVTVVGMRMHGSRVLIHSRAITNLRHTFPIGYEADWSRQTVSRKAWDFCRCSPRLGIAGTFWDYDFPQVLGYGMAAVAYIEPHYIPHRKLGLSPRLGMGVSYLSQPFDSITNPGNQAYSMYLSFPLMVSFGMHYRFGSHWNVRLAANFNHVSNGGIREPNKGLNYPSASLSLDYAFLPVNIPDFGERGVRAKPAKKGRFAFAYASAVSNDRPGGEKQFYISGLSANYSRYLGRSSALTIGTEAVRDISLLMRIRRSNDPDRNSLRAAALVGHEFWLGRVVFSIQFGVYYFDQWKGDDPIYQRYSLTVEPIRDKHFFTGISLKTHRQIADFMDVRVGYWF